MKPGDTGKAKNLNHGNAPTAALCSSAPVIRTVGAFLWKYPKKYRITLLPVLLGVCVKGASKNLLKRLRWRCDRPIWTLLYRQFISR